VVVAVCTHVHIETCFILFRLNIIMVLYVYFSVATDGSEVTERDSCVATGIFAGVSIAMLVIGLLVGLVTALSIWCCWCMSSSKKKKYSCRNSAHGNLPQLPSDQGTGKSLRMLIQTLLNSWNYSHACIHTRHLAFIPFPSCMKSKIYCVNLQWQYCY